jgi:hypothetical protein
MFCIRRFVEFGLLYTCSSTLLLYSLVRTMYCILNGKLPVARENQVCIGTYILNFLIIVGLSTSVDSK